MIATIEDAQFGSGPVVLTGPLAAAAKDTIASFAVVSEMLSAVGNLAVSYGVGKPLDAFQTLLKTYQTLLMAESALKFNAATILEATNGKLSGCEGGSMP